MQTTITVYRRTEETVTLRSWPLMDDLTHFHAEAHIESGGAFVEIDFRYGAGTLWCAKVYAAEPSDLEWLAEEGEEWVSVDRGRLATDDEGDSLMLYEIEPFARNFAEAHFWNDEP